MHRARLRTATVVGHGSSGAAGGMSVRQQKRVLEEIKQYMYQVIIKRLCLLNVIRLIRGGLRRGCIDMIFFISKL